MTGETQQKRILFVDDEPHLLSGLRRSLRTQRGEWEMAFAASGEEALRLAEAAPFDAIVSDMRMPGMDGAELLGEIAHLHPRTIRIVLSGQSDEQSILRLVNKAHQFLAKPCDTDRLQAVLARSFALRALLTDERLQGLVSTLGSLPSIPVVYQELTGRLQSDTATLRDIGRLIAQDPPMTAKLLQLVNSAFFGVGRRITNPEEAASLLGIETLKGLVLATGVFRQFETSETASRRDILQRLWRHSLAVGCLARDIARAHGCDRATVDDALAGGLLHDIGTLLLVFRMPSTWERVQALAGAEAIPHWEAEERIAGVTHNALGAYLLGLWGLPDPVVEAVAFNHRPLGSPSRTFTALTAVHLADALTQGDERLDRDYLRALGLEQSLETWRRLSDALPSEAEP